MEMGKQGKEYIDWGCPVWVCSGQETTMLSWCLLEIYKIMEKLVIIFWRGGVWTQSYGVWGFSAFLTVSLMYMSHMLQKVGLVFKKNFGKKSKVYEVETKRKKKYEVFIVAPQGK